MINLKKIIFNIQVKTEDSNSQIRFDSVNKNDESVTVDGTTVNDEGVDNTGECDGGDKGEFLNRLINENISFSEVSFSGN